jgi:hypothetical protein
VAQAPASALGAPNGKRETEGPVGKRREWRLAETLSGTWSIAQVGASGCLPLMLSGSCAQRTGPACRTMAAGRVSLRNPMTPRTEFGATSRCLYCTHRWYTASQQLRAHSEMNVTSLYTTPFN